MTLEVYGALVAVGLFFGVGMDLLDVDGWGVAVAGSVATVAVAYLVGDRPRRSAGDEPNQEGPQRPDALREIISEFDLPTAKVYLGGDAVHLPAWRLVAVAKRRYALGDDAERAVDVAVAEIGGERVSLVDPWRVLPDLIRKLRGRPSPPKGDLYIIPGDFFRARERLPIPRRGRS